jgi:hypothetical protein
LRSSCRDGCHFQVANYRKPEINLGVHFTDNQALSGSAIKADISARYFFDAPVGNTKYIGRSIQLPIHSIYRFQGRVEDTSWLSVYTLPIMDFGLGQLESGAMLNDNNGNLTSN